MKSSDLAHQVQYDQVYWCIHGFDQGGIIYVKISLDEMFNMSDVIITSIQEFFKKFAQDGVAKLKCGTSCPVD